MPPPTNTPKSHAQVIIVGAGPVGMLTALRLGQAGIDTLVIEGHESLLNTTRAVVYMPVVIPVLKALGILDTVLKEAYLNTEGVVWRDINGHQLAQLPLSSPDPDEFGGVLLMGQRRMNALVQTELTRYPSVQVRFGTKLVSLTDDASSNTVTLTTHDPRHPDTKTALTARYVLGTDGANSTVRHLLSLPFTGFTYTTLRMIGIDVIYDFIAHESFKPLNFIVHPTDWAVVAYTGQNEDGSPHSSTTDNTPQWRVAYVEDPSLPADQPSIRARAEAQMSKYARSGQPWKIIRAEPYTMSQRCAAEPMKGRVMLAGDALHSNNPIGGLGLTSGILDAFCYGNALIRVLRGAEPSGLLGECADARLAAWRDTTDKLSQANLQRLYGVDEETSAAREGLFALLNGGRKGEVASGIRRGLDGMMLEDFVRGTEGFVGVGREEGIVHGLDGVEV